MLNQKCQNHIKTSPSLQISLPHPLPITACPQPTTTRVCLKDLPTLSDLSQLLLRGPHSTLTSTYTFIRLAPIQNAKTSNSHIHSPNRDSLLTMLSVALFILNHSAPNLTWIFAGPQIPCYVGMAYNLFPAAWPQVIADTCSWSQAQTTLGDIHGQGLCVVFNASDHLASLYLGNCVAIVWNLLMVFRTNSYSSCPFRMPGRPTLMAL